MLTNKNRTTLYTGVTSDLYSRMIDHKKRKHPNSFSSRYNTHMLVFFESFHSIEEAIAREKEIKAGSRRKKEELINSVNEEWKDLFSEVAQW
ncbi:GIY-YIG nuclease family protein [Reichenbachiella sp.]|uniref:GIY-YIG nuclease family protein n=1 Tax=Reichenbachiella sp. TaxID=2184521 RepID=UPI003BB147DC